MIDTDKKKITQDIVFNPKVLVIDDEKRIRDACKRLLTEEGCDVDTADNGSLGLKKIKDNHFDIVLLDLMMPGMSGLDVLAKVKSTHPDTLVIVITGYATLEHSIGAMKKGAFDFVAKPFSPKDLRLVVSKAIEFIRTLQDIATEKSRMRVMINTLNNGVLTTNFEKRVALANPAFLKMIGCSKNSIIGHMVSDFIENPTILGMIDRALVQPPDTFAEITDEINMQFLNEEEEKIIGVRCIPFRDRLNRTLGTITVCHDITALKKIDQMKSDFVTMVAHEIKSPLNSILMQLNVVLDGLAGELSEKQNQILSRSADKIKSLTELSSELLDLSKIESGLINQEREKLDLIELIDNQVGFHMDQAQSKSISLTAETSKNKINIWGNLTNIEEILSNLISNAIRYTPPDGKIQVTALKESDCVIIRVTDNGYGIPKEDVGHIFEKFFRSKNENTRFINGTGLGLAIVKSIVEAHNGTIKVESELNKGTTFSIFFPRVQYE